MAQETIQFECKLHEQLESVTIEIPDIPDDLRRRYLGTPYYHGKCGSASDPKDIFITRAGDRWVATVRTE